MVFPFYTSEIEAMAGNQGGGGLPGVKCLTPTAPNVSQECALTTAADSGLAGSDTPDVNQLAEETNVQLVVSFPRGSEDSGNLPAASSVKASSRSDVSVPTSSRPQVRLGNRNDSEGVRNDQHGVWTDPVEGVRLGPGRQPRLDSSNCETRISLSGLGLSPGVAGCLSGSYPSTYNNSDLTVRGNPHPRARPVRTDI